MPSYHAPVRDTLFLLEEVLDYTRYQALPGFGESTPDLVASVLEAAAKFAGEVLQPLNQVGDQHGCTRHADGTVSTAPGFREAYARYVEAGWGALAANPAYGGQGLPHVLASAIEEYFISANMAFTMYPMLTLGAIAALEAVASPELLARYLPPMIDGRWTGTMNLTEPHCGTDLGLLRTRAEPRADGSYAITGTKIFISSGEHDLAENIIHLVLAKLPDAPDSVKGISLFVVPKFLPDADGKPGARNALSCGSLEHKMGIHGNGTCVMNYDGATGYLVGERDKGLRAMFVMMNAARLGVGVQGLAQSEVSYQNAAAYARERLQGRALGGPQNPAGKADPIIVHPDVRRMLMNARAFNEAARGLMLWGSLLVDLARLAPSADERERAEDLVGLLTPVIKGYFTDKGYENATSAQQCLGGHGYIREWGLEQFVRDARIAMIYEGTNGIQALDLVGRKLPANGGRALRRWLGELEAELNTACAEPRLQFLTDALRGALGDLHGATQWLMRNALMTPDNGAAGSVAYLHLMGLVALGQQWLQITGAALRALDAGASDPDFYQHKVVTARYFCSHLLPETRVHRARVEAGAANLMALPAEAF